jgi:hypothetical protein
MADREDNVYKAKLAEQAERYDGRARQNTNSDINPLIHSQLILFFNSFSTFLLILLLI